jgi:hypothetical protein
MLTILQLKVPLEGIIAYRSVNPISALPVAICCYLLPT